ncbi:TetR/AcrR family transcriptional regulator [Kribbella solani]|uniref:TetR/AcrR family transcriptional regulator n=1 Tax=Kribbella solani TaxID=236067 RepID=UPI0029A65367|nr:TetR/AcrR family transcriptional regulator [Kribbella solani]MDX2968129.1 TetR/AcrR family transcriptional regulator [Kribbella solani]MDX3004858.1 TetR/AcrR family transcriptional regulator [Kribbella solani]
MRQQPVTSRSQDPKRQMGAREILDAAALAFSERGYAATSIDDVADVLGATKGRIYHYFRTKGELFIGIHRRGIEWILEAIGPTAERADLAPADKLREMVRQHALMMMEHHTYMGVGQFLIDIHLAGEGRQSASMEEILRMRRQFEDYYVKVVEDGIKTGAFRDTDANLVSKAMLGAVNWMHVWYRPDETRDTPEQHERIATTLADHAVYGIVA